MLHLQSCLLCTFVPNCYQHKKVINFISLSVCTYTYHKIHKWNQMHKNCKSASNKSFMCAGCQQAEQHSMMMRNDMVDLICRFSLPTFLFYLPWRLIRIPFASYILQQQKEWLMMLQFIAWKPQRGELQFLSYEFRFTQNKKSNKSASK